MRNINYSGKKAICSICIILVLWTFGVHSATLPPDPDNAALLYYQAFLLRPEPDADTSASIDEVLSGGKPDEKLREYLDLRDCRETIEFAEAAAQLPQCNWGIRFSQGIGAPLPQLVNLRPLSFLIYADARVLAADGDYRAALGRCLTIRRIAGHVGDDTTLNYYVSLSLDGLAHSCTQDVLGSIPPDVDILTWLRGQLVVVRDVFPSFFMAMEMDLERVLQTILTNPDDFAWFREQLAESTNDDNTRDEILGLTDEELIALVRKPYEDFLNSVFHVMDSEMTYGEKFLEIQRLTNILVEYDRDMAGGYLIVWSLAGADQIDEFYNIMVRNTAQFNALKSAIEIYLIKAKTGQLPETLPDGLPKDPYSGQDFVYETTRYGFVLRCREKEIIADILREFEFKIPNNAENN